MRPSAAGRGAEIMPIVRDLLERDATQQEIARRADTSQGHVRQATSLLHEAPDLAGQVEDGQINITTGYRALVERRLKRLAAPSGHSGDAR